MPHRCEGGDHLDPDPELLLEFADERLLLALPFLDPPARELPGPAVLVPPIT